MKQKIYKSALDNAPIGYAYHRIILDKDGVPIDFEYLEMNSEVVKLYARQIGLLITHKKEEELLKDSKLQYKVLFESNLAGIFVIDKEAMELLLINETALRIFEFQNADDLRGMDPLKLVHPLDREKATRVITDDMFKNDLRKAEELRVLTKSGKELWIRTVGARINYKGKTAGLVSFYDITERKQTEEALFNKNKLLTELNNYSMELSSVSASDNIFSIAARRLKMLTSAISVIMSHYNDETSELVISYTTLSDNDNNRLKQIIGREVKGLRIKLSSEEYSNIISEKQAYKDSLTDTTFGKITPSLERLIKKIFNYQWFGGLALIYKDKLVGTMVIVGEKESVKPDKDVISTFAGITANALQRWNVEKSLKDSEEKYRFITENTVDIIWLMDLKLKYTFISPSVKKMLGYSVDEFINLPHEKFLTEESLKHVYAVFNSEMELEKNSADISDRTRYLQFEAYKKDGSQVWIEATMSFYRNSDNKPIGILGVSRNITEQKLAEIKLKESEGKFRNLAEKSPFAIMIYQQNKFVYTNQMGEIISGFSKEELYNMNYWDFTHPDHKELIKERGQKRQEGKLNIITYDFKILSKDKQTRWVTLTGSMINYNGMPAGLISVIDITQRKKAEEELKRSEHQFKMLLEELPDIVIIHQKGKIVYANKASLKAIGLAKEGFMGTHILDYVAEEHKEVIIKNIQRRTAGEKIEDYEIDVLTKSGGKRNAIIRTTEIIFEKEPSVLTILVDITEQKKAQKLQHEIDVARQSAQFKQNFLANMSHEIRTPLTGIMGMSEFLSNTKLDNTQQDYINTIKHSTENLREIIDLILDYSKIEAGEVQIKRSVFPVSTLIENAENLFKSICKKDIALETSVSPLIPEYINSDQHRINQIVSNLVSNAVKYTKKGKITIKASLVKLPEVLDAKPRSDSITIKVEVTDTGVGINPVLQKHLFKPFTQIEKEDTRNYEGTGLGLSICKELAGLLGGEIGVHSTPGKGSTFWFTFKAKIAKKDGKDNSDKKENKDKHIKPLNILLAEDKKVTQKVVSLMLEFQGHKVTIAENGLEALEKYKTDKFDLVLMDIQMPVMDGITATKKLKEKYKKSPPILGLSANAFEGDREKYMKQGMDEYLTKPVKIEDFNIVLRKLGFS